MLYCHAPPDVDPVQFNDFQSRVPAKASGSEKQAGSLHGLNAPQPSTVDAEFFRKVIS